MESQLSIHPRKQRMISRNRRLIQIGHTPDLTIARWDVVKAKPSKVDDVIAHHARSAGHRESIGEGVLDFSANESAMPGAGNG